MTFRQASVAALSTFLASGLAACTRDKDEKLAQFIEERASAICEANFRCCGSEHLRTDSVEECMDHAQWPPTTAVEEGDLTIDYERASECFARVRDMSCDEWQSALEGNTPPECDGLMEGRANGESCDSPYECTSGHCRKSNPNAPSLSSSSVPGVCAALGKEGEFCILQEYSCELGLGCRGLTTGASCMPYPMGGDSGCEGTLDCRGGPCESGVCPEICYGFPVYPTILGASW